MQGVVFSSSFSNHGSGFPNYQSGSKFGDGIVFDGINLGKSISSRIPVMQRDAITLSFWLNPESDDFHIFNVDGIPVPASISLRKQRPVLSMQGLDQTSLPGTDINEFWANGYLTLNKWSHLALTYNLSTKEVQFYINGELDAVTSFAGNLPFPLNNGFRLGPTDDYQATSTKGGIDDFRIYGASLSAVEIQRLYGGGNGDFNQKTIQFSYTDELELPKVVDVYFLDDGMPVSLVSSGGDAFDEGDIVDINSTIFGLVEVGTGHYQFELLPDDNSSPRNLFVMINGSGMKTAGFGDSFNDSNFSLSYNPQIPVVLSPSLSIGHGEPNRFLRSMFQMLLQFLCQPCLRVSNTTQLQGRLSVHLRQVVLILLRLRRPIQFSSVNQQHELKVVDSLSFPRS